MTASIQLFARTDIPGRDIVQNSIKDNVATTWVNDSNVNFGSANPSINRIGLMWHNTLRHIPFGQTTLQEEGYTFRYFKKELFDYLQSFDHSIVLDLITCDMNSARFLEEVSRLKALLPNVSIEYSLNKTGNIVSADWIMESDGTSIKDVYFTSEISKYAFTLGTSSDNTAIIKPDHTVWTIGRGGSGQLGNCADSSSNELVQVDPTNINAPGKIPLMVSCGGIHTAVLLDDGTVWTFGNNSVGQLGDGDSPNNKNKPVQVDPTNINASGRKAIYVSCGDIHTAVLLDDGTVWTFGENDSGQLGDGDSPNDKNKPVQVDPTFINSAGKKVISLACGWYHTGVVLDDGTVWTFGENSDGQLGDGNSQTVSNVPVQVVPTDMNDNGRKAISVSCGECHTVVLTNDGTVWTFGKNSPGQLGDGNSPTDSDVPVQVEDAYINAAGKKVISISCGANHTLVLLDDETVWSFGDNCCGGLGNGTTTNSDVPVQVWPVDINAPNTKPIAISCGYDHSAILLDDCTAWVFGYNSGTLPLYDTGTNMPIPDDLDTPHIIDPRVPEVRTIFESLVVSDCVIPPTTVPPTTVAPTTTMEPTTTEPVCPSLPDEKIVETLTYWHRVFTGFC